MVNFINGKKIVKVMHQNCIASKAYKEIYNTNVAMSMILESSTYEDMEREWIESHADLFDEYGDCSQETLNQMSDECTSTAWEEFLRYEWFDCGDFTLYIIDKNADMYEITR